jgi:hypothetical protein
VEDLSLLGNAAAVPAIIAITQWIKSHFDFKHKSDVVAFVVSIIVCLGWSFYHTPNKEIYAFFSGGMVVISKGIIRELIVAFATWMSASKSYDLFVGNKKREAKMGQHAQEKVELQEAIQKLREGNGQEKKVSGDSTLTLKLREILERE